MKKPPESPEFDRFTDAMRQIMKVSKKEIQLRTKQEKRELTTPASRVSGASRKQAN
jgi:hypothetical protein